MKITNKERLPDILYQALSDVRPPIEGEIHVTTLIGPPKVEHLRKKYWDELEDDASERLFALLGQGLHAAIANDGRINHAKLVLSELIRDWNKVDRDIQACVLQDLLLSLDSKNQSGIESILIWKLSDKWTLVGTDDHYDEYLEKIMDWKTTSVWSIIHADHNWEEQLNVYAYMRRKLGYEVSKLEVWALIRDWQKSKAKYGNDRNYPAIPFAHVPLRLWTLEEQEEYIYNKLLEFDEEEPRPCTPREMWEKPMRYKVMKKGRKTALIASHYVKGEKQDLLSVAEAMAAARAKDIEVDGTQIFIQSFKGERKRCADYCIVNKYCDDYCGGNNE